MRHLALVAMLGCGGTPIAPLPAIDRVPRVRMIVATAQLVQFVVTSDSGLEVMSAEKLPSTIAALEWVGQNPVVMLQATGPDQAASIGRITPHGFEPVPPFPAATWAIAPEQNIRTEPQWQLAVSASRELWQGRCEWGTTANTCTQWIWAKLGSSPVVTTRDDPARASSVVNRTPADRTKFEAGSDDLLAMYSDTNVSVLWRGREIGTLPGATFVRFAPPTRLP